MKKIVILLIPFLLLAGACQDVLKEEFKNPAVYSPSEDQLSPGLFASALTQWKFYIKDYGEWWWQLGGNGMFQYAQISTRYITPRYSWYSDYDDLVNGNGFDQSGFSWFNDYYTRMRNWGLIRDVLAGLSGQDYDDNVIYMELTGIIKDWAALRNVDLYNSIPYTDAFKGTEGVFFVPYDDPKAVYATVLDDLKRIGEELPGIYEKMTPAARDLLKKQDIALNGNVSLWVQYTNALRLRYAVQLAGVDEATAKTHISDAIKNLPTTDLIWDIPQVDAVAALPGGGTYQRGLYEETYCTFIPNVIMNRMNFHDQTYEEGIDDPRLPVLAFPTKYNDYRGVTMNTDKQDVEYKAGETYYPYGDDINSSMAQNSKSMWSRVTFTFNNTPADMFTLGEIDLLLAEVAAKNLATTPKTAGDYMKDEVIHSTDFWYMMNGLSSYATDISEPWNSLIHPTEPDASVVAAYGDVVKSAFEAKGNIEDQMEMIMQQKYIHINLLRPFQLFGELRRTRHPKIEKMTFQGKVMAPMVERLRYPSSEAATNTENFLKVNDQDNLTSPIFWVTDAKKGESYYRDTDIPFDTSDTPDFQ